MLDIRNVPHSIISRWFEFIPVEAIRRFMFASSYCYKIGLMIHGIHVTRFFLCPDIMHCLTCSDDGSLHCSGGLDFIKQPIFEFFKIQQFDASVMLEHPAIARIPRTYSLLSIWHPPDLDKYLHQGVEHLKVGFNITDLNETKNFFEKIKRSGLQTVFLLSDIRFQKSTILEIARQIQELDSYGDILWDIGLDRSFVFYSLAWHDGLIYIRNDKSGYYYNAIDLLDEFDDFGQVEAN